MNRVLHRYRKEFKVTSKNQVWHTGERVQLGYSTADAVIQVVRVVVGGRSRLIVGERKRPSRTPSVDWMDWMDSGPLVVLSTDQAPEINIIRALNDIFLEESSIDKC